MSDEVKNWLEPLGLAKFADMFATNEIDLDAARDLTESDLRELGIAMGPRKKLLRAIGSLKNVEPALEPAAEAVPAQPGERRQVTVLFADISGYTRLSGELDAEDLHSMLAIFFGRVDAIIGEFGGTVDKHIGDSVMAVFGAPIAHGNDPERAIRAADAIHQAMPSISEEAGRPVLVHIGVASGQVVASGVGGDSHYTVTGDSVNLASRLTDSAGPGETFISANVQRAVAHLCKTDELGDLYLKGIDRPVPGFRLISLEPADRSQSRPFVGRQSELSQLAAILSTCIESNAGQVIYLRGEAGIGKSRLTEEYQRLASERGFEPHRGLIFDFGVGKGQDAIRSLVKSLLGVPPDANEAVRRAGADRAKSEGLVDGTQAAFLNDLLDLPQPDRLLAVYNAMDNSARNQGKCETVATLVRNICASRRLFLIVEDVHWASDLVMEHLAALANAVAQVPALLVMTSRIEGDRWGDNWRSAATSTRFLTVDLNPLHRAESMALAAEFFGVANQFAVSCVDRAEGNPLFLEQLLRGAEAATEGGVPGSVQSIVQARMDVLDAGDKAALQAASVLGQRFSPEALRHLIEDEQYLCDVLVRSFLLRSDGDHFLFVHALVRDGVYNSLLAATRTRLHQRAAEWYRERDPALCAEHLDRADDPGVAAAYLRAARDQAENLDYEGALELARRGGELAVLKDEKADLYLLQADVLLSTGATGEAIESFETAIEQAHDDQRKCIAWSGLAAAYRVADRHDEALDALARAEAVAKREGMRSELAHIHYLRGNVYFPLGRIDECLSQHERSLEIAREVGSAKAEAQALSGLGDALYLKAAMRTACERFRACVELCNRHGYRRIEVANGHMVGWTRFYLMEFREALDDALESRRMAAEVSHRRAELLSLNLAGLAGYTLGELDLASDLLREAMLLANRIGAGNFLAQAMLLHAQVDAKKGDIAAARRNTQQALGIIRKVGMTFIGPMVLSFEASLCDDAARRRAILAEAEQLLEAGSVAHNSFSFAQTAIDDALRRGEWADALRHADRLEAYAAKQPLPWSDFLVARARALAKGMQGCRDEETLAQVRTLRDQAADAGLSMYLDGFDEILADCTE